jgi:hypothetical protein
MRAPRSRLALPLLLAAVLAGAVALVTVGADDTYRAQVALPLEPVIGEQALRDTLRLAPGTARPDFGEEAPEQPGGAGALDEAVGAALRAAPELDDTELRDDIRLIDTSLSFLERDRRELLLRVEQPDFERASLAAWTLGAEYASVRRRWLQREVGKVERRLAAEARAEGTPRAAELNEGAELTRLLAESGLGGDGEEEVTKVASEPLRDVVVAALVGLLLGLAIPRLRGRPCASSS